MASVSTSYKNSKKGLIGVVVFIVIALLLAYFKIQDIFGSPMEITFTTDSILSIILVIITYSTAIGGGIGLTILIIGCLQVYLVGFGNKIYGKKKVKSGIILSFIMVLSYFTLKFVLPIILG